MKKYGLYALLALLLMSGAKAVAQEWEHSIPYDMSDEEMTHQYCAYELSDGRIIVCSARCFQSGMGSNFYPPPSCYDYLVA